MYRALNPVSVVNPFRSGVLFLPERLVVGRVYESRTNAHIVAHHARVARLRAANVSAATRIAKKRKKAPHPLSAVTTPFQHIESSREITTEKTVEGRPKWPSMYRIRLPDGLSVWLPRTQIRAYRWCSPPRIGCAIMSPNRSIGRVQGACVRTSL